MAVVREAVDHQMNSSVRSRNDHCTCLSDLQRWPEILATVKSAMTKPRFSAAVVVTYHRDPCSNSMQLTFFENARSC